MSRDTDSTAHHGMRKVVFASTIGTTVEWYDFFLYGSVAALVFNKIFFPSFDPLVGTLLALAGYAVGFIARPLGGLVFGHFGDILGRKKMLVVSLVLMGAATVAIGLVPSYDSIGIAAPIILVCLRLLQGFAVGGEWGGAVLMLSERGDGRRRGFWAAWAQSGLALGQALSVAVLAIFAVTMADATFEAWGWRIPFLVSGVLVVVGLWVRLSIAESEVFLRAQRKGRPRRTPLIEVLKHYKRELLVAMGARFCENIAGYVFTVFVLTYATSHAGFDRSDALLAVFVAALVQFAGIIGWGHLSDRLGRRPVILFGAVALGVWSFIAFPLIDTGSTVLLIVAASVGLLLHAASFGPQGAFFSELFGTSVRYSGASIGAQFASIFAGSVAPLISVALLDAFGSSVPISVYIAVGAIVTILAVALSKETVNRDLNFDTDSDLRSGSPAPVSAHEVDDT
ncbi:MFS transporter [Prauserella oleivorans]|uniref:MFS transporter n=1 Tax=Prauserella oleivorans TaxID=1478153 RepID=A0ABW5WAP4_9PSEU